MGTINYRTSDYITIGLEPISAWDLENDPHFVEEIAESGEDLEEAAQFYANDYNKSDYYNIKAIFDRYTFRYFHVTIEPGYYEGFYIDIENNFGYCYDDASEKRAAQKEITQLKSFLTECVNNGLRQVFPGWCTSYKDRKTSLEAINAAIKEMRADVRRIPTWHTLQLAKEV